MYSSRFEKRRTGIEAEKNRGEVRLAHRMHELSCYVSCTAFQVSVLQMMKTKVSVSNLKPQVMPMKST